MFSGEIGSLQPRTSYAVARTIGSREMGCTRLHDASIKTQSKQRRLPLIVLGLSVGRCTHLSFRGCRHGGCEPGWCWRLGDRFKQSRSIVGHAIDRGRNFVGFEEIFARRREQRSGDHCVHMAQSSQKSKTSSGRITGMRWWMGCSARGGRQAVFADVPHLRAKRSGAEMRVDAAGGGGKGQLKGTIQDCSIDKRSIHGRLPP